jgi:hypothetical protein
MANQLLLLVLVFVLTTVVGGILGYYAAPPRRRAAAAILAAALMAASWSTGFFIKWRATRALDRSERQVNERDEETQQPPRDDPSPAPRNQTPKPPEDRDRRRERTGGTAQRGGGSSNQAEAPPSVPQPPQPPPGKDSDSKKPLPSLPPAPTRYLYHLVNEETGDHFATTDGGVASEYEAKGYQGGAVGRVYTASEDDTKAITTNYGTAYIFIASSPKTKPPSKSATLWYSTDNDGDFFYTTSKSEASQEGWSPTLIGYVRTLS